MLEYRKENPVSLQIEIALITMLLSVINGEYSWTEHETSPRSLDSVIPQPSVIAHTGGYNY